MQDLIIVRMKAHAEYLSKRILKEKKKKEFINAMNVILENAKYFPDQEYFSGIGMDKFGGINLAIEVVFEILNIMDERFGIENRDGNFFLEKL